MVRDFLTLYLQITRVEFCIEADLLIFPSWITKISYLKAALLGCPAELCNSECYIVNSFAVHIKYINTFETLK